MEAPRLLEQHVGQLEPSGADCAVRSAWVVIDCGKPVIRAEQLDCAVDVTVLQFDKRQACFFSS
jgi:hypothetical protein